MNEHSLFAELLDITDPEARAAHLDRSCDGRPDLRARLERLFGLHEQAGGFLERSPAPRPDETAHFETAASGSEESPGARIGPYHLLEVIGEGGMGTVYMAEQTEPVRRRVALKVIKPGMDSRQVVARFEAERQALALMDHPNIARVFDGGTTEAGGRPYFVMELVRGLPLTDYCDQARLTVRERLELFVQVCRAVQHAHQKGVIHRDLKPSNVLVTVIDGRPVPKVIDFGIAKATGAALTDRTLFTGFHQMVGTPLYMSPEQAELSGVDVDTRSDVYSLGVILYQLLTGTTPVDPETLQKAGFDEMRRIIREVEPPTPSRRVSTLGAEMSSTLAERRRVDGRRFDRLMRGELDWVVMRALEKDRGRRYDSAGAFAADVERYLADEPVLAAPPDAGYRLRKFARRNRAAVLVASAGLLLLALGTVGTTVGLVRALRAEKDATASAAAEAAQRTEAEAQRDRAVREKARADTEAETARAVNDFIRHVLAEADPERNPRSRQVTVEEVLGRAGGRIPVEFSGRPRVEAAIRLTIGDTYLKLGNFGAAGPHVERAVEIRRAEFGDENADTLEAVGVLARLHFDRGQFDRAERLLVESLATCRRVLEKDHPSTLAAANNLAFVYQGTGRAKDAIPLYAEALEGRRRTDGEKHPETLQVMCSLASAYLESSDDGKAEPLLVSALETARRELGAESHVTLYAMHGLSMLYDTRKDRAKAEPLFREVLEWSRRVMGDDHPVTLTAMFNVAACDFERKEYARAEPLARAAVEAGRRVYGPGHVETIPALVLLAKLSDAQDKDAQTAPLLMELIEAVRRNKDTTPGRGQGPAHMKLIRVPELKAALDESLFGMQNMARSYRVSRRWDQAVALLEQAIKMRTEVKGENHTDTLECVFDLATTHAEAGNLETAASLHEKVLARFRVKPGAASPEALRSMHDLALVYARMRQVDKAVPLLEEAVRGRTAKLGRTNNLTMESVAHLGRCLTEARRPAEAVPLLEEVHRSARRPASLSWVGQQLLNAHIEAGNRAAAVAHVQNELRDQRTKRAKDSPLLAALTANYGRALLQVGAHADAEPLLRESLATRENIQPEAWGTHSARSLLGRALFGQRKLADAEPLLVKGYLGLKGREVLLPTGGREHLREAGEWLADLYDATDRAGLARDLRRVLPRETLPSPRFVTR